MKHLSLLALLFIIMCAQAWCVDAAPVAFLGIGGPSVASQLASPGPIGATAPSTGSFTTLSASQSAANTFQVTSTAGNASIRSNSQTGGTSDFTLLINGVSAGQIQGNLSFPIVLRDVANSANLFIYTAGTLATGNSNFAGTLDASSVSTAAVNLSGGLGVAKSEFVGGDIVVAVAGKQLKIKEGTNAAMGTAILVAGTLVVSNTLVTANTRIFLTSQVDGGTPGFLRVSTRTAGTSFTILSSSGADTSTVAWRFIEPSP